MFGVTFYLSSVNVFNLGKPKILSSCKGLKKVEEGPRKYFTSTFYQKDNILDLSLLAPYCVARE